MIGVSLPVHHQAWALVNQPEIAFAGTTKAFGYWWGASLLALAVAALVVPVMPRGATWGAEMLVVQLAWACATVGCGWQPLLDPQEGHPGRWLRLHDLPGELIWIVPLLAMLAAAVPTMRMLALAAAARREVSRLHRLAVVILHLGLPLGAWIVLGIVVRGRPPQAAALAAALPLLAAVVIAWISAPRPALRHLAPSSVAGVVAMLVITAGLAAGLWYCGRPLPGRRVAAVLWSADGATNNIRRWIRPTRPFADTGEPAIELHEP